MFQWYEHRISHKIVLYVRCGRGQVYKCHEKSEKTDKLLGFLLNMFCVWFFFLLLSNRNPSVCEWTGEIYDTNQANHIQLCHSNLVKIIWRDHYNIWWAECSTSTGSMLHLVQFIRIYLYGLCFVSVILIINAKGKWITFPIKFGNSMKTGIVVVWCIATNMNNV